MMLTRAGFIDSRSGINEYPFLYCQICGGISKHRRHGQRLNSDEGRLDQQFMCLKCGTVRIYGNIGVNPPKKVQDA